VCILTLFLQSACAAAVGHNTKNLRAKMDTEANKDLKIHSSDSGMEHSKAPASIHHLDYPWEINMLDCIAFGKSDEDSGQGKVHKTKRYVYASERMSRIRNAEGNPTTEETRF